MREHDELFGHDFVVGDFRGNALEITRFVEEVSERIATLEVIVEIFDGIESRLDLGDVFERIG